MVQKTNSEKLCVTAISQRKHKETSKEILYIYNSVPQIVINVNVKCET